MSDKPVENYDDVTMYGLNPEKMEELLLKQNALKDGIIDQPGQTSGALHRRLVPLDRPLEPPGVLAGPRAMAVHRRRPR